LREPLPDVVPVEIEVVRRSLPLRRPFEAAHGTTRVRDVVLVRAVGPDGTERWGECSALPEPTWTAEWTDGAETVLRRFLVPAALRGEPSGVAGHPMASAAVDTALLQLRLAAAGTTLAAWAGAVRDRVPCGVAVGQVDGAVEAVAEAVAVGYRRVKLKVSPRTGLAHVADVRATWPDLALSVDANGSFSVDDLPAGELDGLGLVEVEQPLPAHDLVGLAAVARRLDTPVCLDESIGCADDVRTALALEAVGSVCLKPGRVGGVAEALRIHDLCLDEGLPLWVGGTLSTGVGKAVEVALAALPGVTRPGDLPSSAWWFEDDVTEPWVVDADGTMAVQ
jgi:O-succinylbenzoate synthase